MFTSPTSSHSELGSTQQQWLARELAVWESQGLITGDAAARIREHYNGLEENPAARSSLVSIAVFTTLSLAALLFGLAVLLVVCFNWEAMSGSAKLAILFGTLLAANGAGLFLRLRQQTMASEVAFFFGSLMFGVSIWQVAQIFHIRTHFPEGMLLWACGTLPLALAARTPLLHALAAVLLSIWAGWEVLGYERGLWFPFDNNFSIDHGAYALPFLVALGLVWGYAHRSAVVVGLYAATLVWWGCLACDTLNLRWAGAWYLLLLGIVVAGVGQCHQTRLGLAWKLIGTRLIAATLVPMTFWQFHRELAEYYGRSLQWGGSHDVTIYLTNCAVMVLVTLCFTLLAWHAARQVVQQAKAVSITGGVSDGRWLTPAMLACVAVAALLSFIQMTGATFFDCYAASPNNILEAGLLPLLFVVAINAAMVLVAFSLILRGLFRQQMWVYLSGVCYFLLWVTLRYFDLFGGQWEGAMLGAAALFALCGLALAGTVVFWSLQQKRADRSEPRCAMD